jgi:hypothetical protein
LLSIKSNQIKSNHGGCGLQVHVFDTPMTKRGIVRVHNGAITDLAFALLAIGRQPDFGVPRCAR